MVEELLMYSHVMNEKATGFVLPGEYHGSASSTTITNNHIRLSRDDKQLDVHALLQYDLSRAGTNPP